MCVLFLFLLHNPETNMRLENSGGLGYYAASSGNPDERISHLLRGGSLISRMEHETSPVIQTFFVRNYEQK